MKLKHLLLLGASLSVVSTACAMTGTTEQVNPASEKIEQPNTTPETTPQAKVANNKTNHVKAMHKKAIPVKAVHIKEEKVFCDSSCDNKNAEGTPSGYMKLTDNVFIGVHGYVHAVFNYDFDAFGGDYSQAHSFAWDKLDDASGKVNSPNKKGVVSGHMKQTRLKFDMLTRTCKLGDVKGYLETDFYADQTYGVSRNVTNGGHTLSNPSISGSLKLRVRRAFIDIGQWTIGQDFSTFHNFPQASTADFVGQYGDSTRQPVLRYTWKANKMFTWVNSLERPSADYISFNSASATDKDVKINKTGDGQDRAEHKLPDFATRMNFAVANGHEFGLRGVVRKLSFKEQSSFAGRRVSKTGYGLGADAKIMTAKGGYVSAVLNYGRGVNQYIAEYEGHSAVLDTATNKLTLQTTMQWGIGLTQPFNDMWEMNLGFSRGTVKKAGMLETGLTYNHAGQSATNVKLENAARVPTRSIDRYFANLMWTPVEDVKFGLEYMHSVKKGMKDSTLTRSLKASGNRVLATARYSF
jgi:hypothetical protein